MMHGLVMLPDSQVYASVGTDIFHLNRSLGAWEAVPHNGQEELHRGCGWQTPGGGASDSRLEWVPLQ